MVGGCTRRGEGPGVGVCERLRAPRGSTRHRGSAPRHRHPPPRAPRQTFSAPVARCEGKGWGAAWSATLSPFGGGAHPATLAAHRPNLRLEGKEGGRGGRTHIISQLSITGVNKCKVATKSDKWRGNFLSFCRYVGLKSWTIFSFILSQNRVRMSRVFFFFKTLWLIYAFCHWEILLYIKWLYVML